MAQSLLYRSMDELDNEQSSIRQTKASFPSMAQSNNRGARILVATSREGAARLARLLSSTHQVTVIDKLDEAEEILKQKTFDLIIAGVYFDDSRMFELLNIVKSVPQSATTTLLCMNLINTIKADGSLTGVDQAASIMGATQYVNGFDLSDAELLSVIEASLPQPVSNLNNQPNY